MRITNHIRDLIEDALIARGYDAKLKELRERAGDLANRVYRTKVPAELEAAADKFDALVAEQEPGGYKSFLNYTRFITVETGGKSISLEMTHQRIWGTCTRIYAKLDDLEKGLREDVEKFRDERDALDGEIKVRRAEIRGILSQAFTPKKLRDLWPDIMPIAEPILVEAGCAPKPQLPAIDVSVLNEALDLPPETTEKELEAA